MRSCLALSPGTKPFRLPLITDSLMKSKTLTLLILGSATLAYAAITASGGSGCCTLGAAAASLKPESVQKQACSASAELAPAEAKVEGTKTAAACPVMAKAKAKTDECCLDGELTSDAVKAETAAASEKAACCAAPGAEQAEVSPKGAQAVLASMNADAECAAPCCGDDGECGDKAKKETAQAAPNGPACCAPGIELAQAN